METKHPIQTDKTLSETERCRWVKLNQTIKQGLDKLLTEVGPALQEIRDTRLYREDFKTWEEFCKSVLGYSKAQANRLVQGAAVLRDLAPIGAKKPERESQIRELARLPSDELRRKAWQAVLDDDHEMITAKDVKKSVRKVQKEAGLISTNSKQKGMPTSERPAVNSATSPTTPVEAEEHSETISCDAEVLDAQGEEFELADGTRSKPLRWDRNVFEKNYVAGKLRTMVENNRAAPDHLREDTSVIALSQTYLLELLKKAGTILGDHPSDDKKGSFYTAVREFQHMTVSMKPYKPDPHAKQMDEED
ncbi:hypothetical protein VSU19_19885 [Verrucomicrobiales bacterium BCK34]|nr:hypothetical protein [Verrucomicrobiales bacterium BCK34]